MIGSGNLVDSCQLILHVSWPGLHHFIFIVLYGTFLFVVPDPFFDTFSDIAVFASAFYLLLQTLFVLESAFSLNGRIESVSLLSVLTAVFAIATLAGYVAGLCLVTEKVDLVILIVNLTIATLHFVCSAALDHGSIFTASLVCAYSCLLTLAGCAGPRNAILILQMVVLVGWSSHAAVSLSGQCETCGCGDGEFSLTLFHAGFALASAHLAVIAGGDAGRWPDWAAAIAADGLYFWALLAPLVLTNREFS
jgi:hypothetical protein